jgi:hypothetical protein
MVAIDPSLPVEESALNAQEEALAQSVVTSFQTLLDGLPIAVRGRVQAEIQKSFPQNAKPRAREMLATILKLVPKDRAVTIDEVKKTVEAEGIAATAKMVANALDYLTRTQRSVRVGHGKYMIDGTLVVTSDNLGGAPSRHEEDDT